MLNDMERVPLLLRYLHKFASRRETKYIHHINGDWLVNEFVILIPEIYSDELGRAHVISEASMRCAFPVLWTNYHHANF